MILRIMLVCDYVLAYYAKTELLAKPQEAYCDEGSPICWNQIIIFIDISIQILVT